MAGKFALPKSAQSMISADMSKAFAALEDVHKAADELKSKTTRNLKAVKAVRSKSRYQGVRKTTKTTRREVTFGLFTYRESGSPNFDNAMKLMVTDLSNNLNGKTYAWAVETLQMMKGLAPIRTENLMESIKILSGDKADNASIASKLSANEVEVMVGIDEEAILPPPHRKRIKHGKRVGKMVTMATFNYTAAADKAIKEKKYPTYQGYDFLRKWQMVAKENMERIFK